MNAFARIVGVFFEPSKTFADIAQRPSWVLPMILVIICVMAVTGAIGQHIGWRRIFVQQAQTSSRMQQLDAQQREQTIEMQVKVASAAGYGSAIIGVPLYELIVAVVLLAIAGGIMSAGLRFRQVFAIVCWAGLPSVISAILTVVVIFLKNPDDFNLQNPLVFNAGAFLDPTSTSKFVYTLAGSLDLFSFWTIFLLATGLKAAAGKRLSFGGALFAVVMPWVLVIFLKAGFTGMFS